MGAWEHVGNGVVRCTRHGEEFPVGHQCLGCIEDPPPADVAKRARRESPTLAKHERALVMIARQAKTFADEVFAGTRPVGEKADPSMVGAKLLDVSIKARRAAIDLARDREAQERVDRIEAALHDFHRRNEGRAEDAH